MQRGCPQEAATQLVGGPDPSVCASHRRRCPRDHGRAIASVLKNPEGLIGTVVNLSCPVEMDCEQMSA